MNSIGRSINSALQLSRIGGGVGISLSNLREAGAPIKGYEGAASGVVPVMKLFEDSFSYSNQLGQRQGAGVVYLNVFHPDIIAFLSTKKEKRRRKKFGLKPFHLVSSFQISSTSWRARMKKCTSSAHTLLNASMECHLPTLTSLKNTMSWSLIQISLRPRSRLVIWKQKFQTPTRIWLSLCRKH